MTRLLVTLAWSILEGVIAWCGWGDRLWPWDYHGRRKQVKLKRRRDGWRT